MTTYKIEGTTEPGRRLIAMAEEFAADFATRAEQHDNEGSFPFENLQALRDSGYLYGPIPREYGGMGVESVHDALVASSRLAEGDASLTLGVNMHQTLLLSLARQWRIACNRENGPRAAALGGVMKRIVDERDVIAAAVSEPDQELTRQQTRATRDGESWIVNGRKIFASMAPGATLFTTSFGYTDDEGVERYAWSLIPRDTPGITVNDDWDALGMRASGSVSLVFKDVALPFPPGRGAIAGTITADFLEPWLTSGPAHASASLGVAERAQELAVGIVAARRERKGDDSVRATIRHIAAENAIDLAAARAVFARALQIIDAYNDGHPSGIGTLEETSAVYAEAQRAKAFMNQAAVRIVDRAMTIAGGASYASKHPLSRLYRDARAGAFMHPLGANLAYEYIGAQALGITPTNL